MHSQVDSQHEMVEIPRQSLDAALLAGEEQDSAPASSTPPHSRLRDCLRNLRLQFLGEILSRLASRSWKAQTEHRKVAFYRGRRVAVLHSLLHLVPLGGAITLLALRWTRYYVSYTPTDSTMLQFVAKFHELLMQASIAEVMLCMIRTEAIHRFVPFGALSGAVQATHLSYLWSLDFLSVLTSPALHRWRKMIFVVAIPTLLVLTALVGPSSAVLMIPRPGSPNVLGKITRYANKSVQDLYPSPLNRTNGLALFDPRRGRTGLTAYKEDFLVKDEYDYSGRILRLSSTVGSLSISIVSATMPTRFIAEGLRDNVRGGITSYSRRNTTSSVTTAHPVVESTCLEQKFVPWNADTSILYQQDNKISSGTLANLGALARQSRGAGEVRNEIYINRNETIQYFAPVLIASPEPGSQSLIAVFATWKLDNSIATKAPSLEWVVTQTNRTDRLDKLSITTCTLSAYWNTAEIEMVYADSGTASISSVLIVRTSSSLSDLVPQNAKVIVLDLTGIDMLPRAGFQLTEGFADASELVIALTRTIAEIPACGLNRNGTCLLPYVSPTSDSSNSTTFEFTATRYGYGYATTSTSIILSVAVVSTYCIVTILYLAYILITGSTSTAWNSAIELVALALQSRRPDHLGYTSVGISSLETFNQSVGIRVNNDELELVFAHDRDVDTRGLRKIERNKAY